MVFPDTGLNARFWESLGLKFLIRVTQEQNNRIPVGKNFDPYAGWKDFQRREQGLVPSETVQARIDQDNGGMPPEWQRQLEKTRKGFFAFTYWELGEDLQGGMTPEKEARRQMLGQLIQFLKLPAGSITFWPPYLTGETYSSGLFWSGLNLLGCRGLVIFGSQAAWTILQDKRLKPLAFKRKNGLLIWVMRSLPAFEDESLRKFEWGYLSNDLGKFSKST